MKDVILSIPKRRALSVAKETAGVFRFVIPAEAGMTGCHECPTQVENFVSEQPERRKGEDSHPSTVAP
jgi:hypothetical protein